ncbi:unnamed protein product [Anisakis simplex]|uniref:DDE_5 domain-containing protein n=1 Tax=Anisakis simplex TaxID=6269 RepID=A0A0M3K5D7_ANISI|nr:unnamed protein product [Anisakis simplex]
MEGLQRLPLLLLIDVYNYDLLKTWYYQYFVEGNYSVFSSDMHRATDFNHDSCADAGRALDLCDTRGDHARQQGHIGVVSYESKSRLQLHQLVTYIYGWSLGDPLQRIVREAGISAVSAHTGVDWGQFCRDICEEWVRLNPPQLGGTDPDGNPIIVEIDESKYFHRKYQRGTWREGFMRRSNISGDPFTSFLVAVRGSYPV